MVDDALSAPLGQFPRKKKRFTLPVSMAQVIASALTLCVAVAGGWALFVDDPFGGEPMAIVSTEGATPALVKASPDTPAAPPKAGPTVTAAGTPEKPQTVTIIDGSTGNRQEIVVGGGERKGGDKAAKVGPGIDARLLEQTRHGMIPKIGPGGARAADVYAQPVKAQPGQAEGPRIAIVIGGLGISASGTSEAFAKLPGPVTFAFSPYGADLERWAARARGEGHEILLQVGMEPFDYPDNDPGPQTLLAAATAEQNMDKLHWFMSRFQGYVGISNLMGARLTANEAAFAPVLRETVKRGLIYVDDGASPRSLAAQVSGATGAPFAKADVVIDAAPSPAQIDAALARLEAIAKSRGVAIGSASTLPVTIGRIAQWARAANARGITLVPVSALATRPKSS